MSDKEQNREAHGRTASAGYAAGSRVELEFPDDSVAHETFEAAPMLGDVVYYERGAEHRWVVLRRYHSKCGRGTMLLHIKLEAA